MPPELKKIFDLVNFFKEGPTSRILSPRIAPVIPEKRRTKGLLSPSLFPFYKDDTEDQIMPIPKARVLEDVGFDDKDREKMLAMIMEVTNARDTVDKAMEVLENLNSLGLGEKILSATEKSICARFAQHRRNRSTTGAPM
ncbi:Pfam:DUF644 [Parelaphostrongylus tenuis]|uniref:Pfam:DUF644 n=1 Tax=Parelaphostrongylus tenuis TaxID=148309 RepID=A0AAD5MY43_PARTN|nr:Pfam:DUF644 [Parelaphostrongylus tenuis]